MRFEKGHVPCRRPSRLQRRGVEQRKSGRKDQPEDSSFELQRLKGRHETTAVVSSSM